MSRYRIVLAVLVAFAIVNTGLAFYEFAFIPSSFSSASLATPSNSTITSLNSSLSSAKQIGLNAPENSSPVALFGRASPILAPFSWVLVGVWVWKGRMRSAWGRLGFDYDVFRLFVKMKGGATRLKLLEQLSVPKDRMQLARELGVDWKAVDRHIEVLQKHGFVQEVLAYGNVRLYKLTSMGIVLLQLIDDLGKLERPKEELAERQ